MKKTDGKRPRRLAFLAVSILFLAFGGLLSCGIKKDGEQPAATKAPETDAGIQTERAETLSVYQDWSQARFLTDTGEKAALEAGGPSVLIYWASWCPHCRESAGRIEETAALAKANGAAVYLINKLDGEKETKQAADSFIEETGLSVTNVYDEGAAVYSSMGLSMLPTVIILDRSGRVTAYEQGRLPEDNRLISMLNEADMGKTDWLAAAIQKNLMTVDGGIRTNYLKGDGSVPSGADELSESMGFMLDYAAYSGSRELFDTLYGRLESGRISTGGPELYPWVVTDKQKVTVNAVVDDFRISRAFVRAGETWKDIGLTGHGFYDSSVDGGRLVDFYDSETGTAAQTFTLCYADFAAMEKLGERDSRWDEVRASALDIVLKGRISDGFPLYYRQYDYSSKGYRKEAFNMAEELVTLLHLAQADSLPDDAYRWIVEELYEEAIYAGYETDGRPSLNKRYESTAVYALTALLAMEKGDLKAARRALSRMEPMRVRNSGSALDGMFGGEDGNGIYSFDQCTALAAYQKMDEISAGEAMAMD